MLNELFLFIGGCICYYFCLATVGGGWLIWSAAILAPNGIQAGSIEAARTAASDQEEWWASYDNVFKICKDFCTEGDYFDPKDEDSEQPIIVSK